MSSLLKDLISRIIQDSRGVTAPLEVREEKLDVNKSRRCCLTTIHTFSLFVTENLLCLFRSLETLKGPFPCPQFEKELWGLLLADFDRMTPGLAVFL